MKTSSFKLYTGPGRISIARYAPRGTPAGFRIYSKLAPGKWFSSVSADEYCRRFAGEILERLDPKITYFELGNLAHPHEPVLLCYEVPPFVVARNNYCHRRMVAAWFEKTLGVKVPEMGSDHTHDSTGNPEFPQVFQDWLGGRTVTIDIHINRIDSRT